MPTAKERAAALRVGILAGYARVADAVAWADDVIARDRVAEAPQALDLAVLPAHDWAAALTLLGDVPGAADPRAVVGEVARAVRERLASGAVDAARAARAMYHLAREGLAPDAEFESMAYYFDDEVDLARQGLGGPMARLEAELLAYLGRLEAPRPAERAAE